MNDAEQQRLHAATMLEVDCPYLGYGEDGHSVLGDDIDPCKGTGRVSLFPLLRVKCWWCEGEDEDECECDGNIPSNAANEHAIFPMCEGRGWTLETDPLRVVGHVDEVMMGRGLVVRRFQRGGKTIVDYSTHSHEFRGGSGQDTNLLATLKAAMETVKAL